MTLGPPTNDLLYPALRQTLEAGKCVAVVGAGMSAADYPLWPKLVRLLCERCLVRPEDLGPAGNDLAAQAEMARLKDQATYYTVLNEIFAEKDVFRSTPRYVRLLRCRFTRYINLNFDNALIRAMDVYQNVKFQSFPVDPRINEIQIYHLHGRIASGRQARDGSIVLTDAEFKKAYDPSKGFTRNILRQILVHNDVCFIGCNPSEQNMHSLLGVCKEYCDNQFGIEEIARPRWFVLSANDHEWGTALEGTGVQAVRYPKTDEAHTGLDRVLDDLAKREPPLELPAGVNRTPYTQPLGVDA